LAAAVCAAVGACKHDQPVGQIQPTHDELPSFPRPDSMFPVRVGVEDLSDQPRAVIVRTFEPIKLTPEEAAVMAERESRPPSWLTALHQPQPGVEHGVSPIRGGVSTGVWGAGGPQVSLDPFVMGVTQIGDRDGPSTGILPFVNPLAAVSPVGLPQRRVGPPGEIRVGEGPARSRARHLPFIEP
jgi:hypothetical protein